MTTRAGLLRMMIGMTISMGAYAQQPSTPAVAPASEARFPWTSSDVPPMVAELHLGDTRAALEAKYGQAAQLRPAGSGLVAEYPERGIAVVLDNAGVVSIIYLVNRSAGNIDGVRVGDQREQVIAHWGRPPLVQGAQAMYPAGNWAVTLELGPEQQVVSLSLARTYGNIDLQ